MYATNFYTPYCLGRSERKKKKKKPQSNGLFSPDIKYSIRIQH